MGSLELYHRFWKRSAKSKGDYTFNGKGERLGDNKPAGQEMELSWLKKLAEHRNIDGWMDYVSPDATYSENFENLQRANKPIGMVGGRTIGRNRRDSPFKKDHEAFNDRALQKEEERLKKRERMFSGHWPKFLDVWDVIDIPEKTQDPEVGSRDKEKIVNIVRSDADDSNDNTSDESGYANVGSAPIPLIKLLDQIKNKRGLDSRRAVIEEMCVAKPIATYCKYHDDELWKKVVQESKHIKLSDG